MIRFVVGKSNNIEDTDDPTCMDVYQYNTVEPFGFGQAFYKDSEDVTTIFGQLDYNPSVTVDVCGIGFFVQSIDEDVSSNTYRVIVTEMGSTWFPMLGPIDDYIIATSKVRSGAFVNEGQFFRCVFENPVTFDSSKYYGFFLEIVEEVGGIISLSYTSGNNYSGTLAYRIIEGEFTTGVNTDSKFIIYEV